MVWVEWQRPLGVRTGKAGQEQVKGSGSHDQNVSCQHGAGEHTSSFCPLGLPSMCPDHASPGGRALSLLTAPSPSDSDILETGRWRSPAHRPNQLADFLVKFYWHALNTPWCPYRLWLCLSYSSRTELFQQMLFVWLSGPEQCTTQLFTEKVHQPHPRPTSVHETGVPRK